MKSVASPLPRSPSPLPPQLLPPSPPRRHSPPPPDSPPPDSPPPSNDIPWRQLFPIMVFRIVDAAVYVVIFPFIVDMVTSFNVPRDRIGLYSGLGEGTLQFVEAFCAPTWARIADKYGRRPALIWGFTACLGGAAMVGFSGAVWHVVFWRAFFGLNPIGVTAKILASEICHKGNRAKVFSIFSPGFVTGAMIGTFLGGELVHPYDRLPWWLGGITEAWRQWPYALPCVVTAGMGVIGVVIGWFKLEETRPPGTVGKRDTESQGKVREKVSYAAALKVPNFVLITAMFCSFQVTTMSWEAIFTIYTYTEVEHGGLGLPVDIIGVIMSSSSLFYIIITPLVLPRIQDWFGSDGTLFFVALAWPCVALLIPVAQYFAGNTRFLMWVAVAVQQMCKNFGTFAWPICDMLTMATFDEHPHLLATGSAISLIAGAGGRAIGPVASGWIYSISTQSHAGTAGRQASWMTFLVVSLVPVVLVRFLPRDEISKGGYEALPMVSREEDEDGDGDGDEDEEDGVVTASGIDRLHL